MQENEKWPFVIGAAIYMDFDSEDVDRILAEHDLNIDDNTLEECKHVIRAAYFATPGPIGPMQPIREIPPPDPFWGSTRITATQAARKYNVPVSNVRRWAQLGDIPTAIKEDKRWSFEEHHLIPRLRRWQARKPGTGQAAREQTTRQAAKDE